MDNNFWLGRWREGRTHFHQDRVMPLLEKYWPSLALPQGSQVLVPLCGKSLDMIWLATQGYQVLGVELSPLAVEQFFAENDLLPSTHNSAMGRHYVAPSIEIICGDIFAVDAATLSQCQGVYDRAALIALPPEMRKRYVHHVYTLLAKQYQGLLLTLEYDQSQMDGPPFSVAEEEVLSLYQGHSIVQAVDRHDVLTQEPKFAQRGLTRLDTVVYRLGGRESSAAT
jgi:thiopurine S-methyltransferase